MKSRLELNATIVANEFIDRYMVSANGEYVKVYLYILRHQGEIRDIGQIADALEHTEADVKRAVGYWVKQGVLEDEQGMVQERGNTGESAGRTQEPAVYKTEQVTVSEETGAAAVPKPAGDGRKTYTPEQVSRLADQEDFTQLLYIAQKYMNKVFTTRECEVFAYLYDGLHMTAELLEYLVEYCVQSGHTSIRYIETVGLNWHERGLTTVEAARAYASGFTKDSFAVMRCFGLTDRKPGDGEKKMIEKWFFTYGFSREMVLEACNRTMAATHSPSFQYADKILAEWKKAGVKTVRDVTVLDEKRQSRKKAAPGKKAVNQFHNFEQRSTDYDAMVLDQVKNWIGQV